MTSLEDRDHGAHRRAPSRPRALMTDPGLPTLALFNGPLMAHVISVTGPAVVASHRELGRHSVIPEPDKVIQVCTAQAPRAGIFHDEEPSDPPHLTHVRSRRE
jgi:hypothetical protein